MKSKPSLCIVIPTLGRSSLKAAKASCGSLPVEVEHDTHRTGAGPSRNRAISRVKTAWTQFLDDDDQLGPDFQRCFAAALEQHGDADCICWRAKFPDGAILPKVPQVIWGNVTIAYAVKTEWAKKVPFVKGSNAFRENEDYQNLRDLEEAGANVVFSPHIAYLVKPTAEAQATANKNNSSD